MRILYRVRALARWLFRRDEIERALDNDLKDYIERSAGEKMRAGMTAAEARRAARIELGGVEQTKDRVRETLALGPIEKIIADLGYALRALRRQKTFTMVSVLTLSLGIGVNVAIFSLFQQILLRPLPVPEPDRLVNLTDPGPKMIGGMDPVLFAGTRTSAGGDSETVFSYPMFRDLEREQQPFVGLAAHTFFQASLSTGEGAQLATGAVVSGSYFSVLGLTPALGRLLGPEDDRVDGEAASVVLSHAYWQSAFGGAPDVLGRRLFVNDVPLTVVGVGPAGFHGTAVSSRASVFVPITISLSAGLPPYLIAMAVPNHERRDFYWAHVFGRLKPGVTRDEAAAAMNTLYRAILTEVDAPRLVDVDEQEREAFRSRPIVLEPGARGQNRGGILSAARDSLELLLAVSGGVLLLCCANVAGLMLLRAATRSGEIAVRVTLGATRMRLASLLLAESLVLALPAALLSLPVAWLALRGASRVPGISAAAPDVSLSAPAALAAIGVAVAATVVVGLLPIRNLVHDARAKRVQAYGARHTATQGVARFRAALATAQVALSMALLATTGVFAQSLANIVRLDLGVDIDSVVMFSLSPPRGRITDPTFMPRLEEALEAIPRVSYVASSARPLLSLDGDVGAAKLEDTDAEELRVLRNFVSRDFFRMFDIEQVAGRQFDDADLERSVVVVNQQFAERFRLDTDAIIGRRVDLGGRNMVTGAVLMSEIVGVVANARTEKVTDRIEPQVFVPSSFGGSAFYVRGALPPRDLLNAVRESAALVDPAMPIVNLQTMEQQFRANIASERLAAGASTAFAVLATALAALGLYGVLAYSVAQRSRELGLRVALGAPTSRIRGMVLRQVTGMAVIGIVAGAAAAAIIGRAAQSLLFGVEPGDPLMFAAAAAVLTAVTLGAAYIPARRASRVDPMRVLRYE